MKIIHLNKTRFFLISILTLFVLGNQNLHAQFWKKKKKAIKTVKKTPPKKKVKSIKDLTKSSKKIEGLFTIFQDTITGSVNLLIKENQLDKEFIYFSQIADGVADAGKIRGSYQGSSIFYVKKYLLVIHHRFLCLHYQDHKPLTSTGDLYHESAGYQLP